MEKSLQRIREATKTIEFDPLPAQAITGIDHDIVTNLARLMLSIKYPARSISWEVVSEEGYYNVICQYPPNTSFSYSEITAIIQSNVILIEDVTFYYDSGVIKICARIRSILEPRCFSIEAIKIIQARIQDPSKRRIIHQINEEDAKMLASTNGSSSLGKRKQ